MTSYSLSIFHSKYGRAGLKTDLCYNFVTLTHGSYTENVVDRHYLNNGK